MSVLVRVLPFWIFGIVTAWISTDLIFIKTISLITIWLVVVLISIALGFKSSGGIPEIRFQILLLVFFTSFIITYYKCSDGKIITDENISIYGKVLKIWEGEKYNRLKILVLQYSAGSAYIESSETVLLQNSNQQKDNPGVDDLIIVETRLQRLNKRKMPGEFPERMFWAGEGIRKKGWIKKWELYGSPNIPRSNAGTFAGKIQDRLCNQLENGPIKADQASVVKAMLLGMKDDLPDETKLVFKQTGISHLLAVSGLHVGLIYLVFARLFFFMKRFKGMLLVEFFAVIAVWLYSLITGFGPSVQRAAGMITLYAIGRMFGRRVEPLQILGVAFILQTAFDPFSIFRFGFQLSYLAIAGILIVYGSWTRLINISNKILKKIWDYAGVSIAAQTFTIPFILIYFHEFPVYFILGNLILVPLGLMVFYLGAIYLLLMATGISALFVGRWIDFVVRLMVAAGEGIAGFPHSVITINNFTPFHLLIYYCAVFIILVGKDYSLYKRLVWLISLMTAAGTFTLFNSFITQ